MISQSLAFAESALAGRLAFLNTGPLNAKIHVYGDTRVASGDAPTSAPLFTFVLTDPAGVIDAATLELDTVGPAMVINAGAPAWARVLNGDSDFAMDCDAGALGSGAEVIVSPSPVYAGGEVTLISATFV